MHARWPFGWVVRFALLFVVYMVCFAIGRSWSGSYTGNLVKWHRRDGL